MQFIEKLTSRLMIALLCSLLASTSIQAMQSTDDEDDQAMQIVDTEDTKRVQQSHPIQKQ